MLLHLLETIGTFMVSLYIFHYAAVHMKPMGLYLMKNYNIWIANVSMSAHEHSHVDLKRSLLKSNNTFKATKVERGDWYNSCCSNHLIHHLHKRRVASEELLQNPPKEIIFGTGGVS